MKRLLPLFAGLLLNVALPAPARADEPQTAPAIAPQKANAPQAKIDAMTAPIVAVEGSGQTVEEVEEVDLRLIFPVQEPLKKPDSEVPDEAAIAAATAAGEVWVNAKSKIYHQAGTTYYGKTKAGFFLPEAKAIEQGYRGVKD